MNRIDLLKIVVGRARSNGFEFRRWYTLRLGLPWISSTAAISLLDSQRRYYALLFSHDFAAAFWKAGEDITFAVPAQSFQRQMPDGTVKTVARKGFTRRSARKDAWRYHLREMALAEEPLRYIRKYLNVEEDLEDEIVATSFDETAPLAPAPEHGKSTRTSKKPSAALPTAPKQHSRSKPIARPLPTGLPAFLRRPFNGS